MERNAGAFLRRAETEIENDNVREARKLYHNYMNQKPDDDVERAKFAKLCLDIIKRDDVESDDYSMAFAVLPDALDHLPDNDELREPYVDLLLLARRWLDAAKHLDKLIERHPNHSEFKLKKLRCIVRVANFEGDKGAIAYGYKLIGYDKSSGSYNPEKGLASDQADVYSMLATIMRKMRQNPTHADELINQMVVCKPRLLQSLFAPW